MVGETGDKSSFGQRFGMLVREAREAKHWSLEALSAAVYGADKNRKGDVSKLETGKTPNPRYSTMRDYARALGLTDAQIEACRPPKAPAPSPEVTHELRLSTEMLKTLAWDFGHDNPRASVGEYEAFLRDKAGELRALQSRIEAMGAAEGRIANLMGAAGAALKAGDFSEADRLLADAEEIQQTEHTLVQVRKQADIREARGDAALLNNDADTAFEHYAAAAAMFDPFDSIEGVERRLENAETARLHGLRFGSGGLSASEQLLAINLERLSKADSPHEWARTQNNFGNALQARGERTGGSEGLQFLSRAIDAFNAALQIRSETEQPLAWALTKNNLAVALETRGERDYSEAGLRLLRHAVEAYETTLRVYTEDAFPVEWAMTRNNLANALATLGERVGDKVGVSLLRRAVKEYTAALRIRTEDAHPVSWAMTQNNLGDTLLILGKCVGGKAGLGHLQRAVEVLNAALRIRTESKHPMDWAMTQENIGLAFMAIAEAAPGEAEGRLREALAAFDRALTVYDPETMPYDHGTATEARAKAAAALAALNPSE